MFITPRMLNLCRFTALSLSMLVLNYPYYVINCLNINHIAIYRAKCLGISGVNSCTGKLFSL